MSDKRMLHRQASQESSATDKNLFNVSLHDLLSNLSSSSFLTCVELIN